MNTRSTLGGLLRTSFSDNHESENQPKWYLLWSQTLLTLVASLCYHFPSARVPRLGAICWNSSIAATANATRSSPTNHLSEAVSSCSSHLLPFSYMCCGSTTVVLDSRRYILEGLDLHPVAEFYKKVQFNPLCKGQTVVILFRAHNLIADATNPLR